jgi:acetyl-CoA carboxylase carboxyl transferase subunit alpha
MPYTLDFEKPLADIEKHILALRRTERTLTPKNRQALLALETLLRQKTAELYTHLTTWQCVQVARHKERPHLRDYLPLICEDFIELRGDRRFGDDRAIQGGLAQIAGRTVMLIGHEKGHDTKARVECNFGVAHPEGYRKALRLMRQAETLGVPIVTLVDTQGAAPDLPAEERGQSQAIGENLLVMAGLQVPIVATILGEGGSGGALALAVADRVLMLEYSMYTVVSPEAASSILWRDPSYAPQAAEAMKMAARDLYQLGLVDELIPEPLGGAHQDYQAAAQSLKTALLKHLDELAVLGAEELTHQRLQKFRAFGKFAEPPAEEQVS